jgi:hypothetical protein
MAEKQLRRPKENKYASINLRFRPSVKHAAEAAAVRRSLTSLIEQLLRNCLSAKGYLPKI